MYKLPDRDADSLLRHRRLTIPAEQRYLLGSDDVDRAMVDNNCPSAVLRNKQTLYTPVGWQE